MQSGPEVIKLFFMLNSAENEICSAYKKIKYHQFKLFSCKAELNMKFFLLKNIEMPTIVGISIFISRKKVSCSTELSMKKVFVTSGP